MTGRGFERKLAVHCWNSFFTALSRPICMHVCIYIYITECTEILCCKNWVLYIYIYMIRYDLVWYGMLWYWVVRCGMAWNGMGWHGMVCYDLVCWFMLCFVMHVCVCALTCIYTHLHSVCRCSYLLVYTSVMSLNPQPWFVALNRTAQALNPLFN